MSRTGVSIRGETYQKVKAFCEAYSEQSGKKLTIAAFVEELCRRFFAKPTKKPVKRPAKRPAPIPAQDYRDIQF